MFGVVQTQGVTRSTRPRVEWKRQDDAINRRRPHWALKDGGSEDGDFLLLIFDRGLHRDSFPVV